MSKACAIFLDPTKEGIPVSDFALGAIVLFVEKYVGRGLASSCGIDATSEAPTMCAKFVKGVSSGLVCQDSFDA